MNLTIFDPYAGLDIYTGLSPDTIEWYIKNAYNKTFFFSCEDIPNFFDIYDIFKDDVWTSGKKFFVSETYNFPLSMADISMELIQDALIKMRMEFKNIEGEHVESCQITLFDYWGGDE